MALLEELRFDLEEFKSLQSVAKRQRVRYALADSVMKFEHMIIVEEQKERDRDMQQKRDEIDHMLQKELTSAVPVVATPPIKAKSSLLFQEVKGYSWAETDKSIKVYVNVEGCGTVAQEDLEFSFTTHSFLLRVLKPKLLALHLKPLKKDLHESGHSIRCKQDEIVVTLNKKESGKWYDLLAKKDDKPKLPTDDKEDPGAGLMKMMKQMYDDGDDEMKKIIGKSWTESREKQKRGES